MAARGTIVSPPVWSTGSAHHVYSGANHDREARWHSSRPTFRAERFIRWSPDAHAVGPASSGLFQWRSLVDLSHHTISAGNGQCKSGGNRALARRRRDVASSVRLFSRIDRYAQSDPGILFWRGLNAQAPRLSSQHCGRVCRCAADVGLRRSEWHSSSDQKTGIHSRAGSPADPGNVDGLNRSKRDSVPIGMLSEFTMSPSEMTIDRERDLYFLDRTLGLAAKGVGQVRPNPLVGAVVAKDGVIVGKGFHRYEGVKHAEVLALEEAGHLARGATVYTNLEPCSHRGGGKRTPPGSDALIAAQVKRVVC